MLHATTFPSLRFDYLALLSVLIIMLAWAAPAVVAVTGEIWDYDQPADDPANEQTETTDVTDDPAVLFASGRPGLHALDLALPDHSLIKQTWSPSPPLHPPTAFH